MFYCVASYSGNVSTFFVLNAFDLYYCITDHIRAHHFSIAIIHCVQHRCCCLYFNFLHFVLFLHRLPHFSLFFFFFILFCVRCYTFIIVHLHDSLRAQWWSYAIYQRLCFWLSHKAQTSESITFIWHQRIEFSEMHGIHNGAVALCGSWNKKQERNSLVFTAQQRRYVLTNEIDEFKRIQLPCWTWITFQRFSEWNLFYCIFNFQAKIRRLTFQHGNLLNLFELITFLWKSISFTFHRNQNEILLSNRVCSWCWLLRIYSEAFRFAKKLENNLCIINKDLQ